MGVKTKITGLALSLTLSAWAFYEGNRPVPYKDPVGIWTECYGHTGKDVVPGRRNTPAECKIKMELDVAEANSVVDACYPADIKPWERASLVLFAGNQGPGGYKVKDGACVLKSGREPKIRRLFHEGKTVQACNEFPKWANPPLLGLITRYEDMRLLCLGKTTGFKWQP